jgi:HK97 family phage portal protein
VRILGLTISRQKTAGQNLITPWPINQPGAWWPIIREGFAGAWQRGLVQSIEDSATHPTFWACLTLIASDIAKCRPKLVEEQGNICVEVTRNSPFLAVLQRPNHYQNRIQFYSYWMLSKLTRGNTYALKERDARGVVTALYLLEPTRVRPMVTPSGDVYYALQQDVLAGVDEAGVMVPAREIIHDSMNTLYHPLVGLSPVYACGHAALQGLTIMSNATRLFKNGSQVGGVLTAPGSISKETAARLEVYWNENFAGERNVGKVAVLGDGLKFEKPTVMSAVDAQLIDQLKWGDEKICATFHVPPYKVSVGPLPSYNNVEALGQDYYGQCLQIHFESIELCLTEGLELDGQYEVEFEIEALDRMDSVQKIDVATKSVIGGIRTPNEARAIFGLPPVQGGDRVYLQKQNWPLDLLGSDGATVSAGAPQDAMPVPAAPVDSAPPARQMDWADVLIKTLAQIEEQAA